MYENILVFNLLAASTSVYKYSLLSILLRFDLRLGKVSVNLVDDQSSDQVREIARAPGIGGGSLQRSQSDKHVIVT